MTDIIGVHPIFGGFLAAFAVPREVALDMVIKIEDLVTVLFLPIYFTRASVLLGTWALVLADTIFKS